MSATAVAAAVAATLAVFFSAAFAGELEYQTLAVTTLFRPPSLLPDLSWSRLDLHSDSDSDSGNSAAALRVRLEHVDTLADTSASPDDLFRLRLRRDASRASFLAAAGRAGGHHHHPRSPNATRAPRAGGDFSSSVVSGLAQGSGEYFTRIGVGTPAKSTYMVLDTGSDIVWLQCDPCRKCYSQADPVFDPRRSTSFATVPCRSRTCLKLDVSGCNRLQSCLYQVAYGDGSFTVGEFSTETLSFRGAQVPKVALGCGHDNEGLFVGAGGLLGLGRGPLSFASQAGDRFGRKFSYCLVDRTSSPAPTATSSVIFGHSAVPRAAVFTPLLSNPKLNTFYYVGLTGVSVGGARVSGISEADFRLDESGNGGVIVDSGTSVTRLVRPAYAALRYAFRAGAADLRRTAGGFSLFDTCYDLSGKTEVKVPTVVLHFQGGADLSLPAANYLIPVNTNGTFCFAFAGTGSGPSIIGNIQQQGYRVVFDGEGSRVGFSPRGCT